MVFSLNGCVAYCFRDMKLANLVSKADSRPDLKILRGKPCKALQAPHFAKLGGLGPQAWEEWQKCLMRLQDLLGITKQCKERLFPSCAFCARRAQDQRDFDFFGSSHIARHMAALHAVSQHAWLFVRLWAPNEINPPRPPLTDALVLFFLWVFPQQILQF